MHKRYMNYGLSADKKKKKTIILSYVNWLHYIYEQAYMVSFAAGKHLVCPKDT